MSGRITLRDLMRNIAWLAMAEGFVRLTRIFAALALAYALEPRAFGAAALVMTVAEFMRTPTRNGVLQAVVRAEHEELSRVLRTTIRINWVVHIVLALVQIALAWPLALWLDAPETAMPIMALSAIFLFYPLVFARVAILHRKGAMASVAKLMAACLSVANLATAALAVLGFGIWSVVLPRVVSALLWVILARRYASEPEIDRQAGADWREVFRYGWAILGAELLRSARQNLDKILVGKILGMEALGLYAFAFNAGLGLSQSLLKGFSDAVFPYFCSIGRGGDIYRDARRVMFAGLAAALVLFGTQAALAPVYVPMLFGERWEPAIFALSILCLSAIVQPCWEVTAQVMRAEGIPGVELRWSAMLTFVTLGGIGLGATFGGVAGAAMGCLCSHLVMAPTFAFTVFSRSGDAGEGVRHAT